MRKDLLKLVHTSNISRIELASDDDEVTIEFSVPVDAATGECFEDQETIQFSASTPAYLRAAAKAFAKACARAVREGVSNTQVRCSTCTAACCAGWLVRVTEHDVKRLASGSVDVKKAVRAYADEVGNPEESFTGHVGVLRQKEGPEGPVCGLLNLETRLCSVYEHRPAICREFRAVGCEEYEFDPDRVRLPVLP